MQPLARARKAWPWAVFLLPNITFCFKAGRVLKMSEFFLMQHFSSPPSGKQTTHRSCNFPERSSLGHMGTKDIVAWVNNVLPRDQPCLLSESIKEICMHLLHMDQNRSFREGIQTAAQLISAVQNHNKRFSQLRVHVHTGNVQPL